MVVAGDMRPEKFGWGEEMWFHTLECNGNIFNLWDLVKITTKDGKTYEGRIGYIAEDSIEMLCLDFSEPDIDFKDIESISY